MKWILFIIIAIVVARIETFFFQLLGTSGIAPGLLLVWLVYIAMNCEEDSAFPAAFILGFISDLHFAPGAHIGLHTITFLVAAIFIVSVREQIFRTSLFVKIVMTIFVCLFFGFVELFFAKMIIGVVLLKYNLHNIVFRSLITAAVAPFIMSAIKMWPVLIARMKCIYEQDRHNYYNR